MAAVNKLPLYKSLYGRVAPYFVYLPVQAGSTQAIKQGEICQLRDPHNFTSYPIIPATNNAVNFYPLIAWQEQKATNAARLLQFAYPMPGDMWEFDLASGDAIELGDKLGCASTTPSQTLDVDATYNIAVAVATPTAVDDWPTVTKVWASFGTVFADAVKHMPGLGAAVAHDFGALGDLSDVGTAGHASGYILVADGTDFEGVAVSGDATLASTGALTIASNAVEPSMDAFGADGAIGPLQVIRTTCTAAGAEDEVVLASAPFKFRILDAYLIARDANAANVTLKNGSNAFTGATAKGTADDTIVHFATIIAEYDEVAFEGSVNATFSAAGSVDIVLLVQPIE